MNTQPVSLGIHLENVLWATDFQGDSEAAFPYALSIAKKYGSKVFLVHVVDMSPFSNPAPTSAMRAVKAQAVREAKKSAQALSAFFDSVPHEVLIRKGDVWKGISGIVEDSRIDLIVVGTHGRRGVSKLLMGSVAERIFRQAPCPVLTVGPKIQGDADRFAHLHSILVPVDFTPESLAAVSYATSLAHTSQARIYLLHVTPAEELPEPSLRETLRNLIPSKVDLSFAPKVFVEAGVPSEKILDLAEELAVDLILLGVKPPAIFRGTSSHQAMATAAKVVSAAPCPVITVRAAAASTEASR